MSASSVLTSISPGLRSAAGTRTRIDLSRQLAVISWAGTPRCYATAQPRMSKAKQKTVKPGKHRPPPERDATGALVYKKQEKQGGLFRPMPAGQLSHPVLRGGESQLAVPVFSPTVLTPEMVGKPASFRIEGNSPFLTYGITKKTLLEYRLASKPYTVIRGATLGLIQIIDHAYGKSSRESRLVLTGPSGCGKTMLLMQAVDYCTQKEWITLYIPRAVHLVDSTTPYVYDLRTQTYLQPKASYQVIQRFLGSNSALVLELTTSRDVVLEKRTIPAGTPLSNLIKVGLDEQSLAPAILDTLLSELGAQSKYPVLLAVDDFQALYCMSRYKDPHFNSIRSFHLSLPRLLMEYASGKRSFARGMVIGAITESDPNWRPPLELREALRLPHGQATSPYDKRSRDLIQYTKGLQSFVVPSQLSVDEAASIFEVWKTDRAYDSSVSDELFLSKFSESSGNAREFVWKGLLSNFDPR